MWQISYKILPRQKKKKKYRKKQNKTTPDTTKQLKRHSAIESDFSSSDDNITLKELKNDIKRQKDESYSEIESIGVSLVIGLSAIGVSLAAGSSAVGVSLVPASSTIGVSLVADSSAVGVSLLPGSSVVGVALIPGSSVVGVSRQDQILIQDKSAVRTYKEDTSSTDSNGSPNALKVTPRQKVALHLVVTAL
jgi:hypothetical protein